MKRLLICLLPFAVATLRAAPPVNIKLATVAPTGSFWHKAILDLGAGWSQATSGRVTLTVYPNGVLGNEAAVVRMMRPDHDNLQAALLTSAGLTGIDDAFNALVMPFFVENDTEQLAMQQALAPILERRLETKGYHLLAWATGGWVEVFSKKSLTTFTDLKAVRISVDGDEKLLRWYAANGFHPVSLQPMDVVPGIKIGLIDAVPVTAYSALVLNIFRDAPCVFDQHVAPMTGAIVISNAAWSRIAAEDRTRLASLSDAFEKRIRADASASDAGSITAMRNRGLTVTTLDAGNLAAFRLEATRLAATMRGSIVPADVYDVALAARDRARQR